MNNTIKPLPNGDFEVLTLSASERGETPKVDDRLAAWRNLRSLLDGTMQGGCRILSLGDGCRCALCNLDRLYPG